MKRIKRLLMFCMAGMLVLSLTACGETKTSSRESKKNKVDSGVDVKNDDSRFDSMGDLLGDNSASEGKNKADGDNSGKESTSGGEVHTSAIHELKVYDDEYTLVVDCSDENAKSFCKAYKDGEDAYYLVSLGYQMFFSLKKCVYCKTRYCVEFYNEAENVSLNYCDCAKPEPEGNGNNSRWDFSVSYEIKDDELTFVAHSKHTRFAADDLPYAMTDNGGTQLAIKESKIAYTSKIPDKYTGDLHIYDNYYSLNDCEKIDTSLFKTDDYYVYGSLVSVYDADGEVIQFVEFQYQTGYSPEYYADRGYISTQYDDLYAKVEEGEQARRYSKYAQMQDRWASSGSSPYYFSKPYITRRQCSTTHR